MELIENYQKALEAIYAHVGFKEDWVVYPLDDQTDSYWNEDGESVMWADSVEEFESESGNYYQDEIYKQRFYSKWVYEGKDFTMIFCNPMTDGMKWFRLFDNNKRLS
jgi:hypothetical protein